MSAPTSIPQNPFRDPEVKPSWAQLSRLAGDRAAIRFEELRNRVGAIAGLREELHFFGGDWGWAPRYLIGDVVLFAVCILPGDLEGAIELNGPLREDILKSRIDGSTKDAIRRVPVGKTVASVKLLLSSMAAVRSFARLVLMKSKVPVRGTN
jgi:hypothetical protein